jgi:uncharacterized Ntn-hydrolase superfamily protein
MTYSILVHDPDTGAFGAAVASRFFAVGALCTHAEGRVGALSTQALVNPAYGPDGMALLREGLSAQAVVDRLVGPDPGHRQRQLHVIDAFGAVAQHTGPDCVSWAGQRHGRHVSVAGNMLAGPAVLEAMLDGFAEAGGPLALRLIAALQAGEAAGGDKRGRQSAAVRVHLDGPVPDLDIRADDHPDPLAELRRLHEVSLERFAVFRRMMAGRATGWGVLDRAEIEAAVARDGQPLAGGAR